MEQILKLLYQAFGAIVFIIAVTLLMHEVNVLNGIINNSNDLLKDPVIYKSNNLPIAKELSYSELIAFLLNPLEYDISINGYVIRKEDHSNELIITYPIPRGLYIKDYIYNSNGKLIEIKFLIKQI